MSCHVRTFGLCRLQKIELHAHLYQLNNEKTLARLCAESSPPTAAGYPSGTKYVYGIPSLLFFSFNGGGGAA